MRRTRGRELDRANSAVAAANSAVAALELPPAVFKTCPWQPRELVATGLRQWLRCCAAALHDNQVIGMPSHAVDESWHGLILCTARYSDFRQRAYGTFLHHHPEGGAPDHLDARADPMSEQLRRTVVAWSMVQAPGERCVLWDLDRVTTSGSTPISTLGSRTEGFDTYHVMNPYDDGIGLDEFVDWLMQAGYPLTRVADYHQWLGRFETALRGLPERQRQASLLPLLHNYQQPGVPLNGSMAPADVFRTAVQDAKIGPDKDIPHISREMIVKYITDLQLLGLL